MSLSNPWNLKDLDDPADANRRKTSEFTSPWATKFSFDPRNISVFNPLGRKRSRGADFFENEQEVRPGLEMPDKGADMLRMGTAFFLAASFGLSVAIVITLLRS